MEIVIAPKRGEARTLLASGRAFYDGLGNKLGAVISLDDITERKRADEAHALLAALVESSEDAIFSKKLDGTIVSWNLGAERLYGYTAEEIVGKSVSILFPPDHEDELKQTIEQLARGERISQYETVRLAQGRQLGRCRGDRLRGQEYGRPDHCRIKHCTRHHQTQGAEAELQKAHEELENRVERRTAELALAKEAAKPPIRPRASSSHE